jgi:peptidyl-prolyl cis-trans isomerase A (cyclophilin A)
MPSGSSDLGSSRHAAGLMLRVRRPEGHVDEFYLAGGLTIGRTLANTIVLAGDESVDRTHARVEVAEDGTARLRCIEPDSTLDVGGESVRKSALEAGARFRIGKTEFECVSGQQLAGQEATPPQTACPSCGSTAIRADGDGTRSCPTCNNLALPVPLDPRSPSPLLVPAAYDDYRADRFVARGGMGLVLHGLRERGITPVAIKVILPGSGIDRRDAERFEKEVEMMARVRHANVVKLLNHGKSGRFAYLVLDWIEGPSLRQVIAEANRAGKLTNFVTAFRWFEQVCKGLAAIHAVGLIHRDLKPSNILIGPDGLARIADLGIAKRVDAGQTAYTTTGNAPGTFQYMAPEQLNAPDTVDGRADLYSLGVTFYELLTGARPVGAWHPASKVNPSVPKTFDTVQDRLLAPRPEQRYSDIFEFLAAISTLRLTPTPASSSRTPTADPGQWNNGQAHGPVEREEPPPTHAYIANRGPEGGTSEVLGPTPKDTAEESLTGSWFAPTKGVVRYVITFALILSVIFTKNYFFPRRERQVAEAERFIKEAESQLRSGQRDQVIAKCDQALAEGPADGPVPAAALALRGMAFVQKENYARALADIDRASELDPTSPLPPEYRGRIFSLKGDPDRAIREFTKSLELARTDSVRGRAYRWRGSEYLGKRQYEYAMADLNEGIRLSPDDADLYYDRGRCQREEGRLDEAMADFETSLRLNPSGGYGWRCRTALAEAYRKRGVEYYEKGQYELAMADLNEGIRCTPDEADLYYHRGRCHRKEGRLDEAMADFETSLRLNRSRMMAATYQDALDATRAAMDLRDAAQAQDKPQVVLETTKGNITLELYPAKAPITVENFLKHVDDGFYDGTIFNWVNAYNIQGGRMEANMREKESYPPIKNEASNGLRSVRGTISMFWTNGPNSAATHFLINVADNVQSNIFASRLQLAVFGQVVEGMDVVDAIAAVKTASRGTHHNVPVEPIVIKSATRKGK